MAKETGKQNNAMMLQLVQDIKDSVRDITIWQNIRKDPQTRKGLEEFEAVFQKVVEKNQKAEYEQMIVEKMKALVPQFEVEVETEEPDKKKIKTTCSQFEPEEDPEEAEKKKKIIEMIKASFPQFEPEDPVDPEKKVMVQHPKPEPEDSETEKINAMFPQLEVEDPEMEKKTRKIRKRRTVM